MPDDDQLLAQLETMYVAVVADVLDALGYRQQVLPAHIRPLMPARRVCWRVFPAQATAVSEIPAEPYKLEIAAIEAMSRGDVLVLDAGDEHTCGFWGELLTTACLYKGVRGVVMTACTRDVWKIEELNFPVFGIGYHPADSAGRADIVEIGQPISIGGVRAAHGDLILGDHDGVVIVPRAIAPQAIERAVAKMSGENLVRADLERGMPLGEAFRKHGIL